MTLGQALQWAINALKSHDIDDSQLEARVLLGYILKLSHAELLTENNQILSQSQFDSFQKLVNRRLRREPTAYIINNKEFYGFDFYVDRRVLIPRPETELLVDEAIDFVNERVSNPAYSGEKILIADVGTGCGAIAITLALTLSNISIIATDISNAALEVALRNSSKHKVNKHVTFLQGNLLEPIIEPVDLIVANLPYIRTSELADLPAEITDFEPSVATDGGNTGLEYICQLVVEAQEKIRQQGRLLLEIGNRQERQLFCIIQKHIISKAIQLLPDMNGINRVVKIDF